MENQKIINLLDNTPNQPFKFTTKNWVEINDNSRGTYNTNSQVKFKTSILKSSLYDYSDAYILVKVNISVDGLGAASAEMEITDKQYLKIMRRLPTVTLK